MTQKEITVINEIPIFPLPNMVFFPKTFAPLHIFEARYRKMVEDASAGENIIGIVLLKEGWESDYFGNPKVHEIACAGKIEQTEKLANGKYNILLYGLTRIEILRFVQDEPYRIAQVRYLKDKQFDHDTLNEAEQTQTFIDMMKSYLLEIGVENVDELMKLRNHSLESIVNQVASMLDFSTQEKQLLLEIQSLDERLKETKKLLQEKHLAIRIARKVKFIPEDPSWN